MLNYATHAIEDAIPKLRMIRNDGRHEDANALDLLISRMRAAQKFILPDHGSLLWDMASVPEGLEMGRLPYSETLLEVPFPKTGHDTTNLHDSSKRVILAEEVVSDGHHDHGYRPARPPEMPTHIRVSLLCWIDENRSWNVAPACAVLPIGAVSTKFKRYSPDEDPYGHNRVGSVSFAFEARPLMPDTHALMIDRQGMQHYMHSVSNDIGTEIRIVAEMTAVLACRNVSTEIVEPPEKLAKARARNGREPFYACHVLTVGDTTLAGHGPASDPGDGYRVRQHLRRGHIRRLSPTHRIWINQMVVAAGSDRGVVEKTYKVKAAMQRA